jgi:isomerase DpgB
MSIATSTARTCECQQQEGMADLMIWIDGSGPPSAEAIADITAVCDAAEDHGTYGRVIVRVTGAPQQPWPGDLTVALVSKWERALRRLERLPATAIAIASGECGGIALDALLATDYRIADPAVRLRVHVEAGATWPGLGLYRLVRQAGVGAVRRAVLLGRPVDSAEAVRLHLIDEVTDDTAGALAAVPWASGPELAIRRQLMLDAAATDFDDALGVHLAACDRELRRLCALELS